MPKVIHQYIQQWCQEHDWTDLFLEQSQFWAFPPGSVLPVPVPVHALERCYRDRETSSLQVRFLNIACVCVTLGAILLTALTFSPIPLLFAFICCAIAVALLEEE